ncbi:MAG: hypothetical protein RIC14_03890 [Filomicrobium sp.]
MDSGKFAMELEKAGQRVAIRAAGILITDVTVSIRSLLTDAASTNGAELDRTDFDRVQSANEIIHKLAGIVCFEVANKGFPYQFFGAIVGDAVAKDLTSWQSFEDKLLWNI